MKARASQSGGRIVSVHEVLIPSTDKPISTEVLAASGGGFRAEWKLKSSDYLAGVETAEVSAGGVFSPEVFVPWPYGSNGPLIADGIFRSDARGDEVAIWPAKEYPFREGVDPVIEWDLASRSAGGTWSSPQLIGTTGDEGANEMAVAIDPTGRFTVVWTSAQLRQMVVGGAAGAQASNPTPLQTRPTGLTERSPQLALTTSGRVIAIWEGDIAFARLTAGSRDAKVYLWHHSTHRLTALGAGPGPCRAAVVQGPCEAHSRITPSARAAARRARACASAVAAPDR
jgi:hypothetical protein